MEYLGTIIGHEGKGSLIVFLRKKVWALTLIAGCEGDGYEMNSTHSQFSITIILTQKGFDEVDKVTNAVFSYLQMLNSEGPEINNTEIDEQLPLFITYLFQEKCFSLPILTQNYICSSRPKFKKKSQFYLNQLSNADTKMCRN